MSSDSILRHQLYYEYVGISFAQLTNIDSKDDDKLTQYLITFIGIAFVFSIILYVVYIAKREFNQMIKKEGLKTRLFEGSESS